MDIHAILFSFLSLLAFAIIFVPISRYAGLGSVPGYLFAGFLMGPQALHIISDSSLIMHIGELGVILLLFLIGLELNPKALVKMRAQVFGMGGTQVLLSTILIAAFLYGFSGSTPGSENQSQYEPFLLVGFILALSSTAFGLQLLEEKNQLSTRFGRKAFAILLFQDLVVVPAVALVPLLGRGEASSTLSLSATLVPLLSLALIWWLGSKILGPVLRVAASAGQRELFMSASVFVVMGSALLVEQIGLSMALGAFLAGLLLSDSEYRHEILADVEPFKGIFLGIFFMSVGMSLDLNFISAHPALILLMTAGLLLVKSFVLYTLGRATKLSHFGALSLAATLPQGGEFAFVLFAVAGQYQVLSSELIQTSNIVVILSMILTPALIFVVERLKVRGNRKALRDFDVVKRSQTDVIIAGFGRFGQIMGRTLRSLQIPFTALELDYSQVAVVRKFGHKVYFGDASRVDLLEAAGAKDAKVLVVAIDDADVSLKVVELAQKHFPHLILFVRARNRAHAYGLLERGVQFFEREVFHSSLQLTKRVLENLGFTTDSAAAVIQQFAKLDLELLERQHKIYKDEHEVINQSLNGAIELEETLAADERIILPVHKSH